jgi:uncharacterized protein YceK
MTHRILACLAVVTLAGCGSMTVPVASAPGAYETDYARMALIDREAVRRGVKVYWINAPRKQVPLSGG